MPRRKDDILLKSAFEETFPDLLRFCFANANEIFDIKKDFVFLDKELSELFPELEKQGGNRFVDMLVKVFLKNGKEECILVHIEIQGGNDKNFAERMFQYWYRIYDRYKVNVTALAVFTGSKTQKRPDQFYKSFLGTEVTYKYNAYHILDHSETGLLTMDNPFALIVLAAQKALLTGKIPEEELNQERLTVARALIKSKKYDHIRISRFLYFLKQFLYIRDPKLNRKFDRQIDTLTGKRNTMGIIETIKKIQLEEAFEKGRKEGIQKGIERGRKEGIEKGIEEGKAEIVTNLINTGKFTISEIANFSNVSEAFVRKVKKGLKK